MINKMESGGRISAIRNRLGYSQERLAELLGVSSHPVSKWETGLSLPSVEILLVLSWLSNISINNILDGSEFIDDGSGIDRGLMRLGKLLVCPECKAKLNFQHQNVSKLAFECKNGHHFDVIDGVVYFNTREMPGELWSLWLKNYDHYLEEQRHPGLPRYKEGELYHKEAMVAGDRKTTPESDLGRGVWNGKRDQTHH